ncbi:MAG: T9SS type A sorting domain-containing protein [Saprospiraceae bacterium]|nr:T9SS type A sorting domain-containing protein [Saprospiraceae bacterium]
MNIIKKISFLALIILALNSNAQNIELLQDLTGDSEDGIYSYGIESASTSNLLYFQGRPFFSTKIYSSTGVKGNANELGFNDSLFDPKFITTSGDNLFFLARGSQKALYVYNETNKSITVLLNNEGGDNLGLFPMKNNSALLVRSKATSNKPDEIWFTNGTKGGTKLIYESQEFPSTIDFSRFGDALIISDGSTNITQKQAIICDGTQAGTMTIKDYLSSSIAINYVDDAFGVDNKLFIYAKTTSGKNNNYMISNSTTFKDLGNIGSINSISRIGSKYIFYLFRELRVYDTTTSKLEYLSDMGSFEFTVGGDNKFFFTKDGTSRKELWETNGTASGTIRISDNVSSTFLQSYRAINNGTKLHYLKNLSTVELWEYDYITKTNLKITDLYPSPPINFIPTLFYFKGKLFFGKETTKEGFELWYLNLSTGTINQEEQKNKFVYFDQSNKMLVRNIDFENIKLKIQIYNFEGKLMNEIDNNYESKILLSDLTMPGVYLVKIIQGDQNQTLKISLTD